MYFTQNLDHVTKPALNFAPYFETECSLLTNNENSFGRFGMFHGWIGVFRCASYKTAIPKVRSKYNVTIIS